MDPTDIITREKFIECVGVEPQHDDLDRSNCVYAGALGHLCCGWNRTHNKPQFMIGPVMWTGRPMPAAT